MSNCESKSNRHKGLHRYIGSWSETISRKIDLPLFHRHLLPAFILLGFAGGALGTEEPPQSNRPSQIAAGATTLKEAKVLWEIEGDLNGDGLLDYAAIVSGQISGDTMEEERLVVLTRTADGSYKLLSQSGAFCGVGKNGKFYELSISKNSLFVRGVWVAEGERYSGLTMQFRYNQNIHDFQLIGEDEESNDGDQNYKVSINYLTGLVNYKREKGKRYKEVKARLGKNSLFKLQDFQCFSQDGLKPNIYIDENFKVKQK